jgi:DnaK suppressor protein
MSDDRYPQLKTILEDHKHRLRRNLSVRLDEMRAHGHDGRVIEGLDAADASVSDLNQYFGVALAEMATETLRRVDRALTRLARGEYGFCVDCRETIPDKRLTALPFALRCRDCEDLHEANERGRRFAAPSHAFVLAVGGSVAAARYDGRE